MIGALPLTLAVFQSSSGGPVRPRVSYQVAGRWSASTWRIASLDSSVDLGGERWVVAEKGRFLSGLALKFADVSSGGQAASVAGRAALVVLARSLWRSLRVNFHWNGDAICS